MSKLYSSTQNLGKYIAQQMLPSIENAISYVKNVKHFVEVIKIKIIDENIKWFSNIFNVKTL